MADKVRIADTYLTRFKGLMGEKSLTEGEGLLLLNCPSVHCFFMKITIDVIYLSGDMRVLGTQTLAPWNIGRHVKKTAHVLELPEGSAWVTAGDVLKLYDNQQP